MSFSLPAVTVMMACLFPFTNVQDVRNETPFFRRTAVAHVVDPTLLTSSWVPCCLIVCASAASAPPPEGGAAFSSSITA
jgi:hypothetical protein